MGRAFVERRRQRGGAVHDLPAALLHDVLKLCPKAALAEMGLAHGADVAGRRLIVGDLGRGHPLGVRLVPVLPIGAERQEQPGCGVIVIGGLEPHDCARPDQLTEVVQRVAVADRGARWMAGAGERSLEQIVALALRADDHEGSRSGHSLMLTHRSSSSSWRSDVSTATPRRTISVVSASTAPGPA